VGWRRDFFEVVVGAAKTFTPHTAELPSAPKKIFILRNNDIGDLLVITPIFDAFRRKFPHAEIIAGVGAWNRDILLNNPNVSRVLELNAPWNNGFIKPQGVLKSLRYIYRSAEAKALSDVQADIGVDVLGSGLGSLLLMRARIPYRLGVRGYAGGESAAQGLVEFCPDEHVGRRALRFAELLGCADLPENRPQIFLADAPEKNDMVVMAPGAGIPEKRWPVDHFAELAKLLRTERICILGSKKERDLGQRICDKNPTARNLCGDLTITESFGVIGGAKLVICNSSMAMHAAAAFRRPAVVLLGALFPSASQHRRQWGYSETVVLGRDKEHPDIFDPAEAAARIRNILLSTSP
jgi:ADP-heptose:LPS heptosyltransferase